MEYSYIDILIPFFQKVRLWFDDFISKTPNMVLALLVFTAGFYLSRAVKGGVIWLLKLRNIRPSARIMLGNIVSMLILGLFFLVSINILDLDKVLKTVLAGAGVAGLAIGLALQGTLSNTFSGIILSLSKDLHIGDQIETQGYTGIVEHINLRTIKLKTPDGNRISIPNKSIVDNPIKNYSESPLSNVILNCGVAYGSDLEEVQLLVTITLRKMLSEDREPNGILFFYTKFEESCIEFEVRFPVFSKSIVETALIKSQAIMAIKKSFDDNGITIPFPIRTLNLPSSILNHDVL